MDHELGRLMRRMRRTRVFDDALLIVLADHGHSFQVGVQVAQEGQRGQRGGDRADPVLREAAASDGGRARPRAGPQRRRAADDRRRARRTRPLGTRGPVRLCRIHPGATRRAAGDTRLPRHREHRDRRAQAPAGGRPPAACRDLRNGPLEPGALRRPLGFRLPDRPEHRVAGADDRGARNPRLRRRLRARACARARQAPAWTASRGAPGLRGRHRRRWRSGRAARPRGRGRWPHRGGGPELPPRPRGPGVLLAPRAGGRAAPGREPDRAVRGHGPRAASSASLPSGGWAGSSGPPRS